MIRFECQNCGQGFKVSDQYAGRQSKCPQCGSTVVVPKTAPQEKAAAQPEMIKFRCPSCDQKIGLSKQYAGKTVRCAKCKNPLQVPSKPKPTEHPTSKPKHETEVLRAGREDAASQEGLWGDMEPLRLAEENAPAVEMPQQAPAQPDDFTAYNSALRGGGSYQDTTAAAPKQTRPGLIIGLACGAAVLVIVVMFIVSFWGGIVLGQVDSPEAEELVERFIYLLEENGFSEAKTLLKTDQRRDTQDQELERLAERMIAGKIEQLQCWQATEIDLYEGRRFLLSYRVNCADADSDVIISILDDDDSMRIEGVAAMSSLGESAAIGSRSYEQMRDNATALASTGVFESVNWPLLYVALVILAVVAIIQFMAVWAIFEKADEPGWAVLIPVYNAWVWARVGDKPGWVGLAACFAGFVPYVGGLLELGLWIFITISVAKAFGRGVGFGLGLCFLPVVFNPILAFDD